MVFDSDAGVMKLGANKYPKHEIGVTPLHVAIARTPVTNNNSTF